MSAASLEVRDALKRSLASGDEIRVLYQTAVASLSARVAVAGAPAGSLRTKKRKARVAEWAPMIWYVDRPAVRFTVGRRVVVTGGKGAIVRERSSLTSRAVYTLERGVEALAVGSARIGGAERLELSAPVSGWVSEKLFRAVAAAESPLLSESTSGTTVWRSAADAEDCADVDEDADDDDGAPWHAEVHFRRLETADVGVLGMRDASVGRAFDADRKEAVVHELTGRRRLLSERATGPLRPQVVPNVRGAVFAKNLLTAAECARASAAVAAMGLSPDTSRAVDACVFAADEQTCEELAARLRPLLPETAPGGGRSRGLSRLWRAYKYATPGATLRQHYDESSPRRYVGPTGALETDDSARSWLSVLIYVDVGTPPADPSVLPGGATRFHTKQGAVAVVPSRGSCLVFWHGSHPDSPLHEGMPVDPGTEKLVIRTDALFANPDARDATPSQ